jgi:hypothetical protein
MMSNARTNFVMLFLNYSQIGTINTFAITFSWLADWSTFLGWLLRIFDIGILLRILGIDHHPDMLMF